VNEYSKIPKRNPAFRQLFDMNTPMTEEEANSAAEKLGGEVYGRAGLGEEGYGVSVNLNGVSFWVWQSRHVAALEKLMTEFSQ
jgi:hypothetical protein